MSDQEPKVISLHNRTAYVAPTDVGVDPDLIDRGSILLLQDIIKKLEAGEFKGVAVMAWSPAASMFENHIAIPLGHDVRIEALKFNGATDLLKDDLLNLYLFGDEILEDDGEDLIS